MPKKKKNTRGGSFRGKFKTGRTRRGKTHSQKGRTPRVRKNP